MLFLWSPVGRLAGGLNSFWILSFGRRRIIFLCVQHSQKYSGRWLLALCRRETLEGKVIVQYYDSPDGDVRVPENGAVAGGAGFSDVVEAGS